jgi:hypothetical protein
MDVVVKIHDNGDKEYRLGRLPHREDGPALISRTGYRAWYINGIRHREDGPAIEGPGEYKSWYLNGRFIDVVTQKQFEQYKKLIAFT